MVKNYTEVIVDEVMADLIRSEKDGFFSCQCEDCLDCVRAIALNKLKPFYITCKVGEVFGKYKNMDYQQKSDVVVEVVRAKEIVALKPSHTADKEGILHENQHENHVEELLKKEDDTE